MAKFKVHLQQYVERVATIEVEAADADEARSSAKLRASQAAWAEGDDAYSVDVYQVDDAVGEVVFER